MSDEEQRGSTDRSSIEQIVHGQQSMARSWSMFVIGCLDRLQSGNLEPSAWLKSYGHYAADTARDASSVVEAFLKLRGVR